MGGDVKPLRPRRVPSEAARQRIHDEMREDSHTAAQIHHFKAGAEVPRLVNGSGEHLAAYAAIPHRYPAALFGPAVDEAALLIGKIEALTGSGLSPETKASLTGQLASMLILRQELGVVDQTVEPVITDSGAGNYEAVWPTDSGATTA